MRTICTLAATLLFTGLASAQMTAPKEIKVPLLNSTGQKAGVAIFKPAKEGGVKLKIHLENVSFGPHGVHIHQNAVCDAPDFKTAGGHFNPDGKQHGFENPLGHHAGDLPSNVDVGENHMGDATFTLPALTMDPMAPNSIFAHGGTSIIVHEHADDMHSDPSGNSGNRIACGVIKE